MLWTIKEKGFDKNKIIHYGNQFLIGHLMLGVRGTLDEYRKDQLVGVNLPMIYDQVGDGWREPINAFNPLYTTLFIDHQEVSLLTFEPIDHEHVLEMKHAVMKRRSVFFVDGKKIIFSSERFVSLAHERLIASRITIESEQPCEVMLKTGIDDHVWDIYGPHLEHIKKKISPYLSIQGTTHEKKHTIHVMKHVTPHDDSTYEHHVEEDGVYRYDAIQLEPNHAYAFDHIAMISVNTTEDYMKSQLHRIIEIGYDHLLAEHQSLWDKRWLQADVVIKGDDHAQRALRYSIYHLLILSPNRAPAMSIPARGISGQTYKGAIFWDTEIFMLPFYLNTDPLSARSIIEYRIQGLQSAKEKASYYGYQGAFYAWESQENGYDACTDYNVTDVFTNRKVRTYFKDKQIHISGDIVYAIKEYIKHTHDTSILKEGALEIVLEVARFYLDYGQYALMKDRFEIKDVMGPDEYHERVHNNAYTNQLVKMVFETVRDYECYFQQLGDHYFVELVQSINFQKALLKIHELVDKVYLKMWNQEGIIEQFDDYFKHRDVSKENLLSQKLHPHEYLGGSGLAGDTQIIKQADVITMLYLFKDRYDTTIVEKNWHYYEPRTEHGSSLSASMYALTACLIGNPTYAYPLFMKSASVDLTGESKHYAGGIYIGGTHPAASGGAYMTAIFGFAGLTLNDTITLNPHLPESFESISFHLKYQQKDYEIVVTNKEATIQEVSR